MIGSKKGKTGCGCLLFVLIVCMVAAALLVHPFPLRVLTGLFVYRDKIVPCDVLLVPRFHEDKNGELYKEALREFLAGEGRMIYVEDDQVLGISVREIVARMAKARGVKDEAVRKLDIPFDEKSAVPRVRQKLEQLGVKRAILIVPEYASKRFHLLYSSESANGKVLFLVNPVIVSYFKREKWWANEFSRTAVQRELFALSSYYAERFKYGRKSEETEKR
jgi:hypothetical protein